MTFFPYSRVSDFFDAEGDFEENRDYVEEAANQRLLEEQRLEAEDPDAVEDDFSLFYAQQEIERISAQAEDEQAHWERFPGYAELYFMP